MPFYIYIRYTDACAASRNSALIFILKFKLWTIVCSSGIYLLIILLQQQKRTRNRYIHIYIYEITYIQNTHMNILAGEKILERRLYVYRDLSEPENEIMKAGQSRDLMLTSSRAPSKKFVVLQRALLSLRQIRKRLPTFPSSSVSSLPE